MAPRDGRTYPTDPTEALRTLLEPLLLYWQGVLSSLSPGPLQNEQTDPNGVLKLDMDALAR